MSRETLGRRATTGRLITTTLAVIAVQVLLGSSAHALTTSSGQRCTVVGTPGHDVLKGTAGRDVICGRGGNDTISGRGGNDVIDGGSGVDTLSGGAGADFLLGGAGSDKLTGGTGADKFSGGQGRDTVSYADHTARVRASVDGRPNDGAVGERDMVTGTVENLTGGIGSDTLIGSSAVNALSGGAGNDTLVGAGGADTLAGDAGNDTLTGGSGPDTLTGGSGEDTASYADHTSPVSVDLDGARDDGAVGERDMVTGTVENLTGGPAADILAGSYNANRLAGGGGGDTLNGGAGNDRLLGDTGDDTVFGDAGDDDLTGGPGADTLDGGPGVNPCRTDPADTASLDTCEDVTPPRIVEWSVMPSSVDTRAADQSVTVTARVKDDLTGPEWFVLSWRSPRGAEASTNCIYNPSRGYTDCSTGSALDQTMAVKIDLPQYSHLGQWTFPWIEVVDRVGNSRSYPLTDSPVSAQPGFYNG